METPLVSVGIPTYNRPIGLERAINCFLNQTYKNIEIIISNNCSSNPEVHKICSQYSNKYPHIKYYKQEVNIGMYKNFEFVRDNSKGIYFMWASDDDIFNEEFITKCLSPFKAHKNLVLSSPICKVLQNEKEIYKFKPSFNTIGLKQMDRFKKIAFYIKKRHSALYGLYNAKVLKKINIHSYIDCDGLILLQLSLLGDFFQLNEELMISNVDYIEQSESQSLTFQKEKLIDYYKMKPKYFLLKYEKQTVFLYFIKQSLKWKLTLTEHLSTFKILYRSFFGYNTSVIGGWIRNIIFLFKKKKLVVHYRVNQNSTLPVNQLNELAKSFKQIIISKSTLLTNSNFDSIKEEKLATNIMLYENYWDTEQAELQYTLDLIKKDPSTSHCLVTDNLNNINSIKLNNLIKKSKYFNRLLIMDKKKFIYPVRNYCSFNKEGLINIGKLAVPKHFQ